MLYETFSSKSTLNKAMAGAILTLFAISSILASFPVKFAQAATITGLEVTAFAEDSSKTTLGVGDQIIISLNYQSSFNDLTLDPAGSCIVNGRDISSTFQDFQDGTYQLVYTVADGDADAASGQIPFGCSFKDSVGDTLNMVGFPGAFNVAINTSGGGNDTGGGDDTGGGNDTGGDDDDLPPAGTFEVSVEPNTGTLNPGTTLLVRVNDTGGVVDFAVDPAGSCTINGKDVSSSFQGFNDHTYQLSYTIAEGDTDVAAGQLSISCDVKNPSGTSATINAFTDNNTLAIVGTTGGNDDDDNTGGNDDDNNGGNDDDNNNTGGNDDNNNTGGNDDNTDDNTSNTDGTLNGNVEGGNDADEGVLAVTSINQLRTVATADGTMENGWKWVFKITVPNDETKLQMKFGNWTHSNNANWISPANNMRISSSQTTAGASHYEMVATPDTYTTALTVNGDLDPNMPGRQIEVTVEMGVPVGSLNGEYTTSYGVKTSQ